MSHLPNLMTDLALILISAGIITLLFKWLKQPLVLGYIVAGILAGPYIDIFPTVTDSDNISTWAEIGVVFLMFALGLEFSFKKLMKVGSTAFITAITEVVSMLLIGYLIGTMLGWSSIDSIFLGCMLSMSSTTIIIKAFDDLGYRGKKFTGVVFGTLVVEDLVAILMMVLLPAIAISQSFDGEIMLESLLKVVFFLVLWFVVGIFLIPILLKKVRKIMNDETLLIIALGLCLGMVVLAADTGFSAALGAFIMGSILAETIEGEHIEQIIKPVKDLFGAIFFVSVGMMVDPAVLVEYALPILIITLVTLVGKAFFSSFGVLLSGQSLKTSIRSGFSLAQIGEFAFIIAALGLSLGAISEFIYPVIIAVSVITTFTTPYFIRLADPFANWLYRILPDKTIVVLERYASGGDTVNHESDWKKLLKNYLGKMSIYLVLLIAIYLLSTEIIYPLVAKEIIGIGANIICAVGTILLMSPFLVVLLSNKSNSHELFMSLWNDSKYNRGRLVSLVLLRVFIASFFVAAVLIEYFHVRYGIGIIATLLVLAVIFIFRSKLNQYGKLEKRFLTNLNEKEEVVQRSQQLRTSFDRQFHNHDIYLTDVLVPSDSPLVGKSLAELPLRKDYGISIVKIIRGEYKINIPESTERIYPQDKLVIVGTDEQIEQFLQKMNTDTHLQDNESSQDISLQSIEVDADFPYLGKSILQSEVGRKYSCLIVGVERNGESIMNPDNTVVFEKDDLIWLVGVPATIQSMLSNSNKK